MPRALVALAVLALAAPAGAGDVELAPFAGLKFGGRLFSPDFVASFSFDESLTYGATLGMPLDDQWRVEFLYSRQSTELRSARVPGRRFPQTVEHYMVGIQEETDAERPLRFFGVFFLGATRLVPGLSGGESDLRFAGALSLGGKYRLTPRLGLRFEARAFYTVVESGGSIYCVDGTCLFQFSGSGIWQGDLTAGIVLRF
jgi:hypothetical protein